MRKQFCTAMLVLGISAAAQAAVPSSTTTVFDDDLPTYTYPWGQQVAEITPFGTAAVDTSNSYTGSASMKFTPGGAWSQGGVGVNSNFFHFADDGTTLSFAVFVENNGTSDTQAVKQFSIQTSANPGYYTPVFNDGNPTQWTVDGQPGNTEFSRGVWHTVTVDLATATAGQTDVPLDQGTAGLAGVVAWADDSAPIYIDTVTLSPTPEPAVLSMLGLGGLLALKRKQKSV